jgi:azurin
MKRSFKQTPVLKKWTALLSVTILFVVSVTIWLVAKNTVRGPGPGQYAGSAENGASPALQQGVEPEQVTRELEIGTNSDIPAFDKTELTAKRGEVIRLRFKNESDPKYHYQFSWVLTKPGKAGEVILQADRAGTQQNFIPKTDDVLAASRLIGAGETDIVMFRAPSEPGDYPYICTFPGQGQAMRGTLKIE